MRIAHLILAHAYPDQLKRLIESLFHAEADFYIHIDLKSTLEDFIPQDKKKNVYFIKKRVKVYWGAYSTVQATLNGFNEILKSGKNYDYINLLSGQDYPVKNVNEIHDFFKNNKNFAFMEFLLVDSQWQEAIGRLDKYHLADYRFPGNFKSERLINLITPKRKMPNGLIPVGHSQWFTITQEHVKYIVDYLQENKNVKRFFKFTWGCDEIIFQTILYNSKFRDHLVNNNLCYIDWSEGKASPKIFTINDAAAIRNSGKLFARKFDTRVDSAILNYLDEVNTLINI